MTGTPCGAAFIAKGLKCHKVTANRTKRDKPAASPPSKSGVTAGRLKIAAGVALGALALGVTASRWKSIDTKHLLEALEHGKEALWYKKKQFDQSIDRTALQLRSFRQKLAAQASGCAPEPARTDAYKRCSTQIGEESNYGTIIEHPSKQFVFKVAEPNSLLTAAKQLEVRQKVPFSSTAPLHTTHKPGVLRMMNHEAEMMRFAQDAGVSSPKLLAHNSKLGVIKMENLSDYATYYKISNTAGDQIFQTTKVRGELLTSLRKMHMAGMVHRDLHANNVMLNPKTMKVKIIDFALAFRRDDPEGFLTKQYGIQSRDHITDVYNKTLSNELFGKVPKLLSFSPVETANLNAATRKIQQALHKNSLKPEEYDSAIEQTYAAYQQILIQNAMRQR